MGIEDGGESGCKEWEERMAERTVGMNRKRVEWRERLEGMERENGGEGCCKEWEERMVETQYARKSDKKKG